MAKLENAQGLECLNTVFIIGIFMQVFNFPYFGAPHDSAKVTFFKKYLYSNRYCIPC